MHDTEPYQIPSGKEKSKNTSALNVGMPSFPVLFLIDQIQYPASRIALKRFKTGPSSLDIFF